MRVTREPGTATFVDGLTVMRTSRALTTQPSVVEPGAAGAPGQPSFQRGAAPPGRASRAYNAYRYGRVGKSLSTSSPSRPRSQKLLTSVWRSITLTTGAPIPEYALIVPRFSATKNRPSAAKRT